MKLFSVISFATFIFISSISVQAQSTFARVKTIMEASCSGSGCHNGSIVGFNVNASATDLYNQLIGVAPLNPAALAKGDKLVEPGYPDRSFLLRKMAHGISPELALQQPNEGAHMPQGRPKLPNAEIEMVRQWIMYGAPQNGTVVNEQTIINFYNGGGLVEVATPPAPPAGEGFQIHFGPIFLLPQEEREYHWKYEPRLAGPVEVTKVGGFMSEESHHLIFYKYNPGSGGNVAPGLKLVSSLLDQFDLQVNATTLATWQYDREHELPEGTAYYWAQNVILDVNFHIKNYHPDSILAAHSYINVYTRPQGTGAIEMYSGLVSYGGFDPFKLNILPTGMDTTFVINQSGINETWHFWILQAHTHSLGKDFQIYLRNPDGTKGDHIYDGHFNSDYTFNQGFFDWEHPAVREFSPLLTVDMRDGLIHEATYNNNRGVPVTFGLTTADEMFITYVHYTKQLPTTVLEKQKNQLPLSVYPNPFSNEFAISYTLNEDADVQVELYSVVGEKWELLPNQKQAKGNHNHKFSSESLQLSSGMYFVKLSTSNGSVIKRVIVE